MSTNNKNFELRPISELMSIVRDDLEKMDDAGLIDEGKVIKVIMACNERLNLSVKEVYQAVLPVFNGKAKLPVNFDKLYYACVLNKDKSTIKLEHRDPFNNSFDRDIIYEAELSREDFGGTTNYRLEINRKNNMEIQTSCTFSELEISSMSEKFCFPGCPNLKNHGKKQAYINKENEIITPFETGEIYIMYVGNMKDAEGNLLFPFHPLITPYYEWVIKEKIIMDAIFNSEGNYANLLPLAQQERAKAWIDAFSAATDKDVSDYTKKQKLKELQWYNKYFKIVK